MCKFLPILKRNEHNGVEMRTRVPTLWIGEPSQDWEVSGDKIKGHWQGAVPAKIHIILIIFSYLLLQFPTLQHRMTI